MKIAAISCNAQALAELKALVGIGRAGDTVQLVQCEGTQLDLSRLEGAQFDLLIIHCADPASAEMDAIEVFTRAHPGLAVLLACASRSPELLLRAMRADVRSVLADPLTHAELREAIERVRARLAPAAAGSSARAKLLAFMPSKGGSGATFVATNLGYVLATVFQKRVLLIDLDFQFGDASYFVSDVPAKVSVADVMKQSFRLDASVLASSCIQVTPSFALLPAPIDPEQAIGLNADDIDRLLDVAAEHFDFILLDVELALDAISIRAMDRADQIFLVLQPMVPYVRDCVRQLALFRSLGYAGAKVHLLSNRSDTDTGLPLKSMEKALGMSVEWSLPNDFSHASSSVNLGDPVQHFAPGSPLAHALVAFGAALCGVATVQASWLGRLFGAHAASAEGE
ncbi:MAG: AAA family ATPase [Pseudomonadota bacterium]